MQTLKARKAFKYGTRALKPGDEFEARSGDGRVLVATRFAEKVPKKKPPPVEKVEEPTPEPEAPRTRRQYRRRDMVAE